MAATDQTGWSSVLLSVAFMPPRNGLSTPAKTAMASRPNFMMPTSFVRETALPP